MIPDNIKTLIEKLKNKTIAKQTIWSKTSRENEFKLELSKGSITIDNWEDEVGMLIDFVIRNESGDVIERIAFNSNDEYIDYKFILELYTLVKREYYKVEETIKTIFDELDSDKKIGKEHRPEDDLPF